ncbi:16 kDa calcium-binding protein isoform 2 [Schistosoma japonicum]|uniref:16 kDa calcium-binding protein isoform 2 n=1 Tax=Schistosoma japonicum TaxID=6182 RepID=A0A4Z2DQW0_SCHJA|nr:Cell division control protein 31 [Schistosoma japonicum]TNN18911.1 16 kDa calcium-binding protein isoform 2 [Schistosoma japonicum]
MDKRALIEKFHQMDKNCDGVLTANEIRICVQRSGLPESKVNEFLRLFDLSGDNVITLQEYICALGLQPPPPKDVKLWRRTFDEFDEDHSGHLSLDEIRSVLHQLGYHRLAEDALDRWMQSTDKNCDQVIDFPEFCAFLYENYQE